MLPTIGAAVGGWAGAGAWARASAIAPIAIATSPRKRTRRSVSMASPPRMLPYALEARRSYVGGPRRWGNRPGSGAPRRRATGAAPARGADRRSAGPIPGNARPSRRDHRALAPGLRTIGTPGGLRDGLRPRQLLLRLPRDAAARESHLDWILVRRLARCRAGRQVSPPARGAGPGRRVRHQGQGPGSPRKPGRLQHATPRASP